MKNLFVLIGMLMVMAGASFAQKPPKVAKATIHTTAICDDCKGRIEGALNRTKGVKTASLDLASNEVTVTFSPKKMDEEGLRKAIAAVGYDADAVKANQEAYDNLPLCCRKKGHCEEK
jgi:periplasmic mercuric ion binding protein